MEVFNPQQNIHQPHNVILNLKSNGKKEPAKPLTTDEYHESLFDDKPALEQLKVSPERSDVTEKKSDHKSADQLEQIKPESVYEYLQASINQSELKHQIKQVIEMK